jgi:hypothetical protein
MKYCTAEWKSDAVKDQALIKSQTNAMRVLFLAVFK